MTLAYSFRLDFDTGFVNTFAIQRRNAISWGVSILTQALGYAPHSDIDIPLNMTNLRIGRNFPFIVYSIMTTLRSQ